MAKRLQVHAHSYVRGPNANKTWLSNFRHSHEGGDRPHEHPDTGPSCYDIDRDEWERRTGLRGGGRKKYTAKPTGPQFDSLRYQTPEELTFDVIVVGDGGAALCAEQGVTGPTAIEDRLHLQYGLRPRLVVLPGGKPVPGAAGDRGGGE